MILKKDILYEDEYILVCYKKAGMPVQTRDIRRTDLESEVKKYISRKTKKPCEYLGVIHRLDQPVEGIVVFAKTKKAAASLSAQLNSDDMNKQYLAVTEGIWQEPSGLLTDYLLKDAKANMSKVVTAGEGKISQLEYKVMSTNSDKDAQLLRIHLLTGRHHQIRVQMKNANHGILGDEKYNAGSADVYGGGGLALCAYSLSFKHPETGREISLRVKPQGQRFEELIAGAEEALFLNLQGF